MENKFDLDLEFETAQKRLNEFIDTEYSIHLNIIRYNSRYRIFKLNNDCSSSVKLKIDFVNEMKRFIDIVNKSRLSFQHLTKIYYSTMPICYCCNQSLTKKYWTSYLNDKYYCNRWWCSILRKFKKLIALYIILLMYV